MTRWPDLSHLGKEQKVVHFAQVFRRKHGKDIIVECRKNMKKNWREWWEQSTLVLYTFHGFFNVKEVWTNLALKIVCFSLKQGYISLWVCYSFDAWVLDDKWCIKLFFESTCTDILKCHFPTSSNHHFFFLLLNSHQHFTCKKNIIHPKRTL